MRASAIHRWTRGLLAAAAATVTLALAGCGSTAPSGPGGPPTSASTVASTATSPVISTTAMGTGSSGSGSLSASALAPDGSGSTDAAPVEQDLTGRIKEGVESGCTVLVDDAGTVLANLIGFDPTGVDVSGVVTVSGSFNPDLMTTCQQGRPFEVTTVRAG